MKPSKKKTLKLQMLRRRRLDVDDRRGCEEVLQMTVCEEGLVKNVDGEVVVDEVLEVDLLLSKMSKTKSVQMSMLEVVAKRGRREDADHVVKDDVEEVVQKMVMMCRCGGVVSLMVGRVAGTLALLPC